MGTGGAGGSSGNHSNGRPSVATTTRPPQEGGGHHHLLRGDKSGTGSPSGGVVAQRTTQVNPPGSPCGGHIAPGRPAQGKFGQYQPILWGRRVPMPAPQGHGLPTRWACPAPSKCTCHSYSAGTHWPLPPVPCRTPYQALAKCHRQRVVCQLAWLGSRQGQGILQWQTPNGLWACATPKATRWPYGGGCWLWVCTRGQERRSGGWYAQSTKARLPPSRGIFDWWLGGHGHHQHDRPLPHDTQSRA